MDKIKNTLIVNLFSGPGAGKSTLAAHTFSLLKMQTNLDVELVTEFAKQLTWSERANDLTCQPYVFGKQLNRMYNLLGKVDVIITDSPLLLSVIYTGDRWPGSFKRSCADIFLEMNNLNFLIRRVKNYNPNGRNQTLEEAKKLDIDIEKLLLSHLVVTYEVEGLLKSSDYIINVIKERASRI